MTSINVYDFLEVSKNQEDEQAMDELLAKELQVEQRARREKKNMNYNINQQFSQMLSSTQSIKAPKIVRISEHQLYLQRERLEKLMQKEADHKFQRETKKMMGLTTAPHNQHALEAGSPNAPNSAALSKEQQEEANGGLTNEEKEEKEMLMKSGFPNWLKGEFNLFLQGCEKYGR